MRAGLIDGSIENEVSWEALSQAMDDAVRALCSDHPDLAIVATGGYGRSQLCIHSDIDLMLLVESPEQPIPPVFRALWDAGLSVGHSVRTLGQVKQSVRESFETACSLLDARHIGGNVELFTDLVGLVGRGVRARTARPRLADEEQARRSGAPHHLQAVDLKRGRGGLRSLQAIRWLAGLGEPLSADSAELDALEAELLGLRQALHAAAGRATDTASVTLRGPAAAWWGGDEPQFLSSVLRTTRRVDNLVADFFGSDLDVEPDRPPTRGARIRRRADRVDLDNPWVAAATLIDAPPSSIHEALATLPDTSDGWTEAGREAFIRVAGSGPKGRLLFDALERTGHLTRLLPEWPRVVSWPQTDPFHLHPLDDHLWRTAAEVGHLAADEEDTWTRDIIEELGSLDDVVLASLFHDIGKGTGRDHSEAGAEIAATLTDRAGFGPVSREVIARLVRDHLLLPRIATRHDLNDPQVIHDVAARVGDPDVLRMLYLLTVADARATGPEVSTPWRTSLIRTLFVRAVESLESTQSPAQPLKAARIGEITEALTAETAGDDITAHLSRMPDTYVLRTPSHEVRRHLMLLDPLPGELEVRIDAKEESDWTDVVVAMMDRPGLLATVSGVMALSNISIVEARLATRRDGVVIDQFSVIDLLTGGVVDTDRLTTVLANLRSALSGALDLEERLRTKHQDYVDLVDDTIVPEVRILALRDATADAATTRLELRCADRVGLLHDVTHALHDLGIGVRYAKIDTQGARVIDTFHITDPTVTEDLLSEAILGATAMPERD